MMSSQKAISYQRSAISHTRTNQFVRQELVGAILSTAAVSAIRYNLGKRENDGYSAHGQGFWLIADS